MNKKQIKKIKYINSDMTRSAELLNSIKSKHVPPVLKGILDEVYALNRNCMYDSLDLLTDIAKEKITTIKGGDNK